MNFHGDLPCLKYWRMDHHPKTLRFKSGYLFSKIHHWISKYFSRCFLGMHVSIVKETCFFQQKPNPHELMRSFGKSSLLETCHFTTPKKPTAGNKYTSPVDDQNVFCLYRNQKPVPTFEPQKTFTFHYTFTDWFTGILIKAYYNAYIIA